MIPRFIINTRWLIISSGVLFFSGAGYAQQYDAVLDWSKRVTLATLSDGVVSEVFVDVGDRVKKGELLLQLDQMVFEKRVKQTAVALKSADENFQENKRERERSEELYNRTVLSDHELQIAKNNQLRAQAELELARVQYEKAKYDLKYSRITAPFNALVLQRQAQPGQVVTSDLQPLTLLAIAGSDHMRARIKIRETDLAALKMQQSAKVYVGTDSFAGRVVAIGFEPIAGNNNASIYPVDIEFDTGGKILRAGLSAKVEIE